MLSIFRSRRARWAVPIGTATAVAAAIGLGSVVAGASSPDLPDRTAAELLAGVADSEQPFSGTVVQTSRLGLPDLPQEVTAGTGPVALLTGSHTARIWYASPEQARFALMGTLEETNIIRDGHEVWVWTSETNGAQHFTLPPGSDSVPPAAAPPTNPQAAAELLLAAVDPSTEVVVDGTAEVAGRAAYELVLSPRDEDSLIQDVRLAVDGDTSMPLRVQVNAEGEEEPAFEVGFTSVTFGEPSDDVFRFNPPPGATVEEHDITAEWPKDHDHAKPSAGLGMPAVVGEGWTSVLVVSGVSLPEDDSAVLDALLGSAAMVSGSYGTGHLLETALMSALLLDDGRLFVGAVTPEALEEAAASAEP
jgi:outer membrane lipoprotein-sorting protein